VDLHVVGLLDLRHDEDARGAGVDAALALGDGDPLHAVHPTLELEHRPGRLPRLRRALGLDRQPGLLVAAEVGLRGVDDLRPPAALLGVAQVHPQQVAGEEGRLLAPLPRLDLEDRVAVVVGVARHEQAAQVLLRVGGGGLQAGQLRDEGLVLEGQLPRRGEVALGALELPVCRHGGGQRGIPLVEGAHEGLVGVHGGIGETSLELGVLLEDGATAVGQRGGGLGHRGSFRREASGPDMQIAGPDRR
jgi:hypothetical protein